MKNLFCFFISLIVLFISCRKDKDPKTPKEPEPVKEIINTLVSGSNCTSFERLFKGYKMEEFMSVKQTKDEGYIFCGSTETIAESESDILVVKTDCFGKTEWMKTISNTYSDYGFDIIPVSTGGYFITAKFSKDPSSWKSNSTQCQLISLDDAGNVLWKKNCNIGYYTTLYRVIETAGGDFLILGRDEQLGGFILKTNAGGGEIWIKYLDNINLNDVATYNNNYITCGSITINNHVAIYLAEMNADGDTLWTKSIDKNIGGGAGSITILSNNEIAVSGTYRTSNTTFVGFVMRLDATGKEIWYKSLEAEGIQSLVNIASTTGDDIITVGTKPGAFTIVKLDFNTGSIVWTAPKSADPLVRDFQLSADGGFIIVGGLFQHIGNRDAYVLKTDKNGI
jgi:hypothetical protein